MKTIEDQITELKNGRTMKQLKEEDVKLYYKVKSLSSKLSIEKSRKNGNFITKSDLVEYRSLIIWILKNKVDYRGYLNLNNSMTILLNRVENEKIIYKTKKGIKGIVVKLTISCGLEDVEKNLRESTGNTLMESFQQHRLNVLMNS